jgi:hypothetical protein
MQSWSWHGKRAEDEKEVKVRRSGGDMVVVRIKVV